MNNENSSRINLTGDLTFVKTINGLQNHPEAWLKLLNEIEKLPEGNEKRKILKYYFVRVKKMIDVEQYKNNESFAKILIQDALYLGQTSVGDAREAFEQASTKLRRVPLIHIAFAQFELLQGRRNKALKALQFGITFAPAHPSLQSAIAKLNDGETNITNCFMKQQSPLRTITPSNSSNTHSQQVDINMGSCRTILATTTPKVQDHTMAEVLDLPSSPCFPELNSKIKPGLKTPQPRINFSSTKSISCRSIRDADRPLSSSNKINKEKEATSSNHNFGKPMRILRSSINQESDDEGDVYSKKNKASSAKLMQSPQLKAPGQEKVSNHIPPPLPRRVPIQHSSESELQDWVHENKILTIHKKPYLQIKELGAGGSSKVFEVLDLASKSIRAVKQVNLIGCDDDSVREGFINEIKFLKRLNGNQHIVHLYDFELTDNCILMVMECGSTDLAKLMHKHKANKIKLEPYKIWYFWKEMLASVKTIHDHGVIHMDLKPANFLFVKGNLKLIDFGIANSIQADATSIIKDTQCGTLNYMAPEAIMDMSGGYHATAPKFKISPRADVWSLGCILYLMMYGHTPFQHITHQIMKLNAITNPACGIDFGDFPDKNLLAIVKRCLERDPKMRPTVEQLLLNG